jgi:REP element-mobilizing transposase RayT
MVQDPYLLDATARKQVLEAIQQHCAHRGWTLLAAHVRSNHVQLVVVVEDGVRPERVMNECKAYASRRLNEQGNGSSDLRRWARHGSTRWLWTEDEVNHAVRYVVEEQGEPMAVFVVSQPNRLGN